MNYFGCLEQQEFECLSDEGQLDLLLSKGIYTTVNVIPVSLGEWTPITFNKETKQHLPNKMVIEDLYEFIVEHYQEFVMQQFYNFCFDFNEKKYGLKKSQQRKIALKYFKTYFDKIATKAVSVVTQQRLENGGIALEHIDKLAFLKDQQKALKVELAKTLLLQQYLFGNNNYFVAQRIDEFEILANTINFEGVLNILLSLNGRYHFEEGVSFSDSDEKYHQQNIVKEDNNTTNKKPTKPSLTTQIKKKHPNKTSVETKSTHKRTNPKKPLISDSEAINYLLETIFRKVRE